MRAFRKWHHDLGLPAPAFFIQTLISAAQHSTIAASLLSNEAGTVGQGAVFVEA
jgi:hypothetical protein